MTAGRNNLQGNESFQDLCPLVLTDSFAWSKRDEVLAALADILSAGKPLWTFGGAYLFLAAGATEGRGDVLYIGETLHFDVRMKSHLLGPATTGNAQDFLSNTFREGNRQCVLALLVVVPDQLPGLESPEDGIVWESDVAKRAGEALEALLLKAHLNWKGRLPPRNRKEDQAKAHHCHDGARFVNLMRYLLNSDDASADFVTFEIRGDREKAKERLVRHVQECGVLKNTSGGAAEHEVVMRTGRR
jgi:hypothetical protein